MDDLEPAEGDKGVGVEIVVGELQTPSCPACGTRDALDTAAIYGFTPKESFHVRCVQ
ncbi:hypothetical protein GCM10018965_008220 [Nonomuraea roseola]